MNNKQRLELTWIGKDERPRLEPRILLEDTDLSYRAEQPVTDSDIFDNRLIHGDNLLALKALEQEFTGKVKCIFIDPPYNTGSAFTHYDDGIEHSLWLSLMRDRLEILRKLLREDGFIFVQIDYRESARLKLLLDEVFGTSCFRNEIIVGRGSKNIQSQFSDIDSLASGHDTVYLYAKTSGSRLRTLFTESDTAASGKWDTFWRGTDRPTMRYELLGIAPEKGQWRWSRERAYQALELYKTYLSEHEQELSLDEFWKREEERTGEEPNLVRLGPGGTVQYYVGPRNYKMLSDVWLDVKTIGKVTDFPHEKHEQLLARIIAWVSDPGDLVLDSFAGSGTTGAVAQKMGRRWIMVELGEHCRTHIVPRLHKVIDGNDPGGITEAVGWKGGGGFRYYRLAPSLLETDQWNNWVINGKYNPPMLAEAVCKLMGFTYQPSDAHYWMQGHSSERDFIYVTTQSLTHDQLKAIAEEVGEERSLLVCCKAFKANVDAFPNLTVRKIPHTVLKKCEWGKDDYSLNVSTIPDAEKQPRRRKAEPAGADLFGEEE